MLNFFNKHKNYKESNKYLDNLNFNREVINKIVNDINEEANLIDEKDSSEKLNESFIKILKYILTLRVLIRSTDKFNEDFFELKKMIAPVTWKVMESAKNISPELHKMVEARFQEFEKDLKSKGDI